MTPRPKSVSDFQAFIDRLIVTEGSATAVARHIGMSVSAFVRAVRAGTLSIENCLLLAEHAGAPALDVLRWAGKTSTADLIERLVGPGHRATLPARDRQLLSLWHALEPDAHAALLVILRDLSSPRSSREAGPTRHSA